MTVSPIVPLVAMVALFAVLSPVRSEDTPVRLTVEEETISIKGREVAVMAIRQSDGTSGYSPSKDEGFHVKVVNHLSVPTSIHWHGLILPNLMDGVPFVTQDPIPPGGSFVYDFPLKQAGTYWMHSHYGLQEQLLNSAPLVIWTPEERALADLQHVVMLSDFSFSSPLEILKDLKAAKPKSMAMAMPGKATKEPLSVQVWDESSQRFTRGERSAEGPNVDVIYDALLANRKTIEAPEVVTVPPGKSLLLRIVAASSATDFFINTGALEAELLAVDGQAVEPLKGNFFQLAVAQRIDLRVTMPESGGAFPVLYQGEGTRLLAATVLVSEDQAVVPALVQEALLPTGGLSNLQEKKLRSRNPLPVKPVDRSHPGILDGTVAGYTWTINGEAYPNRQALDVKEGERVEIVLRNDTKMGHPMHLHGHDFQVVEIDGEKLSGALRDTVEVPPGSTIKIIFDANNPGVWAFHCHILYHMATGMFTVVKYEGADTRFWQPERSTEDIQKSIPPEKP